MTVKELRAKTGLSQVKFAEFLKSLGIRISHRTIQDWEQGHRTPPDHVVDMMELILMDKWPGFEKNGAGNK